MSNINAHPTNKPSIQPINLAPDLTSVLGVSFKRECLIAFRNMADAANPLLFFFSVMMFVPLGISPNPKVLAAIAPGLIWTMALLATLLSLDRLFVSDYDDGSLEQMMLCGQPMYWLILCKIFVHWLITGLPLMVLSPLLGLMLALPPQAMFVLMASLFLGTLVLSLLGAIGAALIVSLKKGGLLLSLIIMPLYVPVLVFGTDAVKSVAIGAEYGGQLAIMGAMAAVAILLAPLAAQGAIKINLRNS